MADGGRAPSAETAHVVVTCRNAAPWVGRCIASLRAQLLSRFSCVVVDDASTDATGDAILEATEGDQRFSIVTLPERAWPARARAVGLENLACARPSDIVLLVDGDDWLYDSTVLSMVHAAHHERRLLVTYGSYVRTDGVRPPSAEYPLRVRLAGSFRSCPWYAAPLRTFRFGLWAHVRDDALRDSRGRYYRFATDRALFLPLLELAGIRSGLLRRPLYVYNCDNPNTQLNTLPEVEPIVREIHAKAPYRPLSIDEAASLLGPPPRGEGDGASCLS